MYARAHTTSRMCRSEENLGMSFLLLSWESWRLWGTQIARLRSRILYSLSHLSWPLMPRPPNILFSFPLNGPRLICRASVARVPCIGNQCGQCPTPDLERNSEVSPITYFYETKLIRGHLIKLVSRIIPRKSCLLGPCYLSVQSHPPFSPPADHDAFRII